MLPSAFLLIVGAPIIGLLVGSWEIGVLFFAPGVILLGIRTLLEDQDRTVGWVLVMIGSVTAVADLMRLT